MSKANRIQQVDLDLIKPYWRNPRRAEAAVDFVARSITRYGFTVPIVVDGENTIILGHTRYRAARQIGMKKVPVIVAKMEPDQARQFRIAENKTSEFAKWDESKLTMELAELSDLSEVMELFGGPEWYALLNTPMPGQSPPGTQAYDTEDFEVTCPHCGHMNIVPRNEPSPTQPEPTKTETQPSPDAKKEGKRPAKKGKRKDRQKKG